MLKILYEDAELIVVVKPAGVESQSAKGFEPDMVSQIKTHLSTTFSTNGGKLCTRSGDSRVKNNNIYVGVIHRLDKPVSGVMVYAKTKSAAAALSSQVQAGTMDKYYEAVVCGKPVDNSGRFVDFLRKDGKNNRSEIVDKSADGAKRAELEYEVTGTAVDPEAKAAGTATGTEVAAEAGTQAGTEAGTQAGTEVEKQAGTHTLTRVRIHLLTGRHHQIRVQFAAHGTPLWGDNRYNPDFVSGKRRGSVALCSVSLSFDHPTTGKRLTYTMKPTGGAFRYFRST